MTIPPAEDLDRLIESFKIYLCFENLPSVRYRAKCRIAEIWPDVKASQQYKDIKELLPFLLACHQIKILFGQELEALLIGVIDSIYVRHKANGESIFTVYAVEDLYGRPPTDKELRELLVLLEFFKSEQN